MPRLKIGSPWFVSVLAGSMAMGCNEPSPDADDGTASSSSSTTGQTKGTTADSTDVAEKLDINTPGEGWPPCGNICAEQLDLLIVVDDSHTMGEEQRALARSLLGLVDQLEGLTDLLDREVNPNVQIMVTTTGPGNPLCARGQRALGEPVSSSCTTRLDDFTDPSGTVSMPEACLDTCPVAVEPMGDPFIAFSSEGDNIPDTVMPADVDGDGDLDSPAAQALACLAPQGIRGCDYESPLEAMWQALDPEAEWNTGSRPFLRPAATLAIVIVSDEADCSVQDESIMEDAFFQNIDPDTGMPAVSSAVCWNAGVSCGAPDMDGAYSWCVSETDERLWPTERYLDYLINDLREDGGKEVVMLGLLGVPPVTAHSPESPFEPTAGGALELVYRDWRDGEYPAGDILPAEFAMGVDAADKQFELGIGPGCTGIDAMGAFTGQGIPPVRAKEVCEGLSFETNHGTEIRCCLESICDDYYSDAFNCLAGLVQRAESLPG